MSQKQVNGKVGKIKPRTLLFNVFDVILLNVRWYCRYALSNHDLEEMVAERGIKVDHSTINLWVLKYAPELDKRIHISDRQGLISI